MTLTRADKIAEITKREALAAALKRSTDALRAELQADAVAEFQRDGGAPSWTFRYVGRATLPLSKESPVVVDVDALVKWVKERHPEHIEVREEVRPAYQTYLLGHVVTDGEVVVDPETGEVIPGMGVRQGNVPGTLTITPDREVKDQLRRWADDEVARLLVAENGPVDRG